MYLRTIPVGQLQANCYIFGAEYAMYVAVIDPGDQFELIRHTLEEDCKIPSREKRVLFFGKVRVNHRKFIKLSCFYLF